MAQITMHLYHKGHAFDVDVECDVATGGSNRHGSDEPEWAECGEVAYTHPQRARPVSPALTRWIEKNHGDNAHERLLEEESEW